MAEQTQKGEDMDPFERYVCPLEPASAQGNADPFGISDADLARFERFNELPMHGLEGGCLASLLLLGARVRGASDDDVCEYIAAPHDRLPLVGIERELLDRLLAVMVERGAPPEKLIELIRETSSALEPIIAALERAKSARSADKAADGDGCDASEQSGGRHGADFAAQ
jgi:hypothetical protein